MAWRLSEKQIARLRQHVDEATLVSADKVRRFNQLRKLWQAADGYIVVNRPEDIRVVVRCDTPDKFLASAWRDGSDTEYRMARYGDQVSCLTITDSTSWDGINDPAVEEAILRSCMYEDMLAKPYLFARYAS